MLKKNEYKQVAYIHSCGIFKGFLSSLGQPFLSLLYESIDKAKCSVVFVARENGVIVGFVAGTGNLGEVYRIMLRSWWRLFVALAPALISPAKVFRIAETVLFGNKNDLSAQGMPKCELLSIAVLDEHRGKGHAENLFKLLCMYFQEAGEKKFKIVVGETLLPAHRFYKKMGAYPIAKTEVHKGSGSLVYFFDL